MPNKRKRLHYFLISGLLFVFIFGSLFWILNQETSAQPLAERSGISSPPTFDLQITKSVTPTSGPPGTTVTYTIVISNNGPQIANDLIISDTLPPAFIVGQVDTGGDFVTQTITPTLSWSYPTLNAGERDSLTLTGIFSGPFTSGPVVTNTAVITQSPNRPLPVLMAGGQCPTNEIDINGSDITFVGNIHSNGDVQSTGGGGVGVTIFGYVYHNTGTNIPNTNTTISPTIDNPVQSVPRNYLIDYNYADFVPASEPYSNGSDGWAYTAIMAFNPAHYHYFPESTGDVTMADLAPYMNGNQLEDGVYVTPVGFKFSGGAANGLIGDGITFVTRGEIDFSGSGTLLQPYFNGLLMVTDGFIGGSPCDNNAVVKLSGSNWDWGGIIFAPNGGISFGASSNLTFIGSLIGAQIDISGSNLYFTADQQFKPVDSNPSNNTAETPFNLILPPTFDLEITKSVTPTTGLPGTAVTYTLTISNNGPLSATNLLISDILPPELISVQVDTGGAFITQSIAPNLSWSYPLLNPGQRDSLTITGIISPAVINGPTITNTADIYQSIDPYQTVIMAGGSCPSNDIDINGSQVTFLGNIHSNGDIQVTGGGQGNVITGFVTHGTGTNLPNPNTTLSPTINNPSQVPPRAYPIVLEYADFVSATEPYSNGEDGWPI